MQRCVAAGLVAAFAALTVSTAAQAQSPVHRPFPATALRGELNFTAPPEVLLNGQPARLAPGSRIRGENNLLATPASLAGQKLLVHYTREATTGLLLDVWVLSAAERVRKPWPVNEAQAKAWAFDPAAQTWSAR